MQSLVTFFIAIFPCFILSQKTIEMENINGVYQIPCKVNSIPMKFILDTGASNVTISLIETQFLIKQGLLTEDDFLGNVNYQTADGTIKEGTKIKLKTIEIENIILKDILATIIHEQDAPLLLGQSAIQKLGPYKIDTNKLILEKYEDKLSENKLEFRETLDWIVENINIYSYRGKDFKSEYFITDFKHKSGGFVLGGYYLNTKNENETENNFVVPIHKIQEIQFAEIEENKDLLIMYLIAKNGQKEFIVDNEQVGSMFPINLVNRLENDNMKERFINAFKYLIQTNSTFLNEKF